MMTTLVVTLVSFAVLATLEPTPRQLAAAERSRTAKRASGRLYT